MAEHKLHVFDFFRQKFWFLKKIIQIEVQHYKEIKNIENEKLLIPIIKRAYNCLFIHYFFLITTFLAYSVFGNFNNITRILNFGIAFFVASFSYLLQKYSYLNFIKNNILKASTIFFIVNLLAPISTVVGFKYWISEEKCDNSLSLVYSCYWIVHFYNLIPGRFVIKIFLYFLCTCSIFAISCQKLTIGLAVIIATMFSFAVQSYILWSKYHEDCVLLNNVEAEKSMNNYLQDLNPNPIFNLSIKLEIVKMNLSAFKLFHEEPNFKFKDFAEKIYLGKEENLYNYLLANQSFKDKEFFKKTDKKIEKIIVSSNSFQFGSVFHRIVVLQNITEIVNKHVAEISEKYHNLILFSASHEIRSNLNIITGNLHQLMNNFDRKFIIIAQSAAKIMETKLNLLMDFVQIIDGTFKEHRTKFSLRSLIDEIVDIIKLFASDKKLKIYQKYINQFDEEIECDYNRIFSILIHIGLNSVKFTLKGSISIQAFVENEYLNINLKDTGLGMNSSLVNQINDSGESDQNSIYGSINNTLCMTKENNFLSGIGLKSASLICKSLGGSLFVKSKKEMGTTFQIQIRITKVCDLIHGIVDDSCFIGSSGNSLLIDKYGKYLKLESCKNEDSKRQLIPVENLRTLLIVVVDDQNFNRKVLLDMLLSLGYKEILEAENGLDAIKKCDENKSKYDQITFFMDVDMPVMDGIEATRILKSKDKLNQIKIVMQSAFNGEDIISACFEAGAIDFCTKPLSFKKLKQFKEEKTILF